MRRGPLPRHRSAAIDLAVPLRLLPAVDRRTVARLGAQPMVLQLPVGSESDYAGVIDLLSMKAIIWEDESLGAKFNLQDIPADMADKAAEYREKLIEYLQAHHAQLDADSRRRLEGNPLRVLDSKNPEMRALIDAAPVLTDHLDPESQAHFRALCAGLEALGIPFRVNPRLVRGLDYYSRTVFEWITDALGAQDAVCSGGRYDGLIGQLGGEATPGIGFAMGVERLVALLTQAGGVQPPPAADVYIVVSGSRATASRCLRLPGRPPPSVRWAGPKPGPNPAAAAVAATQLARRPCRP